MRQGRVKMETAAEPIFIGIDVSKDAVRQNHTDAKSRPEVLLKLKCALEPW